MLRYIRRNLIEMRDDALFRLREVQADIKRLEADSRSEAHADGTDF